MKTGWVSWNKSGIFTAKTPITAAPEGGGTGEEFRRGLYYLEFTSHGEQNRRAKAKLWRINAVGTLLENQITKLLRTSPALLARDIARILGVEKSAINSLLYGKLSKIVMKNEQHEWQLVDAKLKDLKKTNMNEHEKTDGIEIPEMHSRKNGELDNFIKYCLGYVKLTRERTVAAQQRHAVNLSTEYLSLIGLLNGDTDGSPGELIKLPIFYKYDPRDVPLELEKNYAEEKILANAIEDIYNKHRNDQFTKQVVLSFGYFEIELPIETNDIDYATDEGEEPPQIQTSISRFPLFSMPIRIEKEIGKGGVGKYYAYSFDPEVQVNIGVLEDVLGSDLYFQLLEEMGRYEMDGALSVPILQLDVFMEIWHKVKAQLRLKDAKFNEQSFSLQEFTISLSPKANYFLAEDLAKLAKLPEELLEQTSLMSWIHNDELDVHEEAPTEKELYFPFLYDKYQIGALSLLKNKASIIQGPPGTGKSETISNLLCHLAATGNRVLFVSQKAQALKVVKDKLKSLNVKYLFGYLPSPSSAQIGEEDELDGIAPQLSGVGAHIEHLAHHDTGRKKRGKNADIDAATGINDIFVQRNRYRQGQINELHDQREKHREEINSIIDSQRSYYKLSKELTSLKPFDFPLADIKKFDEFFSNDSWQHLEAGWQRLKMLIDLINEFQLRDDKEKYDVIFNRLDKGWKSYAEWFLKIKEDVSTTGYDRHSKVVRSLVNILRNIRLSALRQQLPREILDYVDALLSQDISRSEAANELSRVQKYCMYHAYLAEKSDVEGALSLTMHNCGITDVQAEVIRQILQDFNGITPLDIKQKVLRTYAIREQLNGLSRFGSANKAGAHLKGVEQDRPKRLASYLQNIIDGVILKKWFDGGPSFRSTVQKLSRAFGKSKKAFKTFDSLRKEPDKFQSILELIPIWIMELDDASRIVPLEANLFDYVILDEASQCNVAYTLPVMYRAKRILFVGDSEQMRDSTIIFKSNRVFDELAHRYQIPDECQIKSTGNAVQSVLDIAKNRGFLYKSLHFHYRSPAELIGFSNKYFYKPNGKNLIPLNSNYLTFMDTQRVSVIHEIKSDWSKEISDRVNVEEAEAILQLFKLLRSDVRYKDKSIGILSFFNAQATFIRELFEKEGFKEENDNYKVSIIEGIQGDEKDIIIYSFVIRSLDQKNKYVPLSGEGGDIQGEVNKGRVNVAFSRARLQTHCFISMPISDVPDRIWIKKYLEYVQEHGVVAANSDKLEPFDSHFEEEFYHFLRGKLDHDHLIQNQVRSCGFRMDFVVTNPRTGKRIVIECDGPTHFKDEIDEAYGIYVEDDEERQRVLVAAGWKFCRLKYSDWLDPNFDRAKVTNFIAEQLV